MSLKSVLYILEETRENTRIRETKVYVGYEAVEKYIETEAEGRYMQSIKSFLPNETFEKTEIFRKTYELEELIGYILRTIKERGEQIIQKDVTGVVLGRPVVFSEDFEKDSLAEKRLQKAAQSAGFKDIIFLLEPIAAALSFEEKLEYGEEKIVLVGDFGAGTSDFTILRACKKNQNTSDRSEDILASDGVYIGGDIFDSDIMWEKVCKNYGKDVYAKSLMGDNWLPLPSYIMDKLKRWNLIPQLRSRKILHSIKDFKYLVDEDDFRYLTSKNNNHMIQNLEDLLDICFFLPDKNNKQLIQNLENLITYNYGYLLFQSIERAKCELSSSDNSNVFFDDYDIVINEPITLTEFEEYIADKVKKIDECVQSVIKKAGIPLNSIDAVFLTGGSSFIPIIQKIFKDKFNSAIIQQSDAFTSVAYGLGLYAKMLG
jgi:hypothetical chaperone protein